MGAEAVLEVGGGSAQWRGAGDRPTLPDRSDGLDRALAHRQEGCMSPLLHVGPD